MLFEVKAAGKTALVNIIGDISQWQNCSQEVTAQVDALLASGLTEVKAYINSYGGDVLEAFEIINQIQRFAGRKEARIGAIAASAASYITACFDYVTASPNTQIMWHNIYMVFAAESEQDFDSGKKLYSNLTSELIARYAKKTGLAPEKVRQMMSVETWMSAEEAKTIGFVDAIEEFSDTVTPPPVANKINAMKKITNQVEQPHQNNAQELDKPPLLEGIAAQMTVELARRKGIGENAIHTLLDNDVALAARFVLEYQEPVAAAKPTFFANQVIDPLAQALITTPSGAVKSYDEMSPGQLKALHQSDPQAFEKIYQAKFSNE